MTSALTWSKDIKTSYKTLAVIVESGYSRILYIQALRKYQVFCIAKIYCAPDKPNSFLCKPDPAGLYVPETKMIDDLLVNFSKTKYLALVVDEYGGTSGLITWRI